MMNSFLVKVLKEQVHIILVATISVGALMSLEWEGSVGDCHHVSSFLSTDFCDSGEWWHGSFVAFNILSWPSF
jgi:hypothetical protein